MYQIKYVFVYLLCFLGSSFDADAQAVNWMTIEEALTKSQTEPKKIFIDIYTSWCQPCKKMDQTTFNDPSVAYELNKNFYPVRFDAEQKEDIYYKGKKYVYKPYGKRGYHSLAAYWSESLGNLSYPTLIFIDQHLELIQPIQGYQTADDLIKMLRYISGDHYKRVSWNAYLRNR